MDALAEDIHEVVNGGGGMDGDLITQIAVNNTFDEWGNLEESTRTVTDKDANSDLEDKEWTQVLINVFDPHDDSDWCLGSNT